MLKHPIYDAAIIGGGLAGLSAAILLAKNDWKVILFEKEHYPFHKVCGEYISLESYDFLISLGLPLPKKELPVIRRLTVSAPSGTSFSQKLPLGGFGISRFAIDDELSRIAVKEGVTLRQGVKVTGVAFENDLFTIATDEIEVTARAACGAFGKRSNLDVKWNRDFVQLRPNALNNYIAVKYHVEMNHPRHLIALHNFKNGYCGISPVEQDKTCICYLTSAENLRTAGNHIPAMEQSVLCANPFIKQAFANAKILYEKPLVISQISFNKKDQVENHVLMLGDAAGLIAPLCGNGMSMAMQSARMAAALMDRLFRQQITREQMEAGYRQQWKTAFGRRLRAGRMIQAIFGKEFVTNAAVGILKYFPYLVTRIIRQTHG